MRIDPGVEAFTAVYERGVPQVVFTRAVADLETPVSAYLKLTGGAPLSFLLESVQGGETRGRYSIIGADPDLVWRCRNGVAEIDRAPGLEPGFEAETADPLSALRRLVTRSRIALPDDLPPMASGLFGYLGYDMVRLAEPRLPAPKDDPLGLDDAVLMRPRLVAVFDTVRDELILVTPVFPDPAVPASAAYAAARERLDRAMARLETPLSLDPAPADLPALQPPTSNTSEAEYHAIVARCQDYIRAGDAFQIVPSQRFRTPFSLPPFALYRALRRINPSPFLYFLQFAGFAVVGSSPEILVRLRGGTVTIRPIAGTSRRGRDATEDLALAEALLADPKERAEHLMLVDLGRNDVGRVAAPGSVRVVEQYTIERYSHVMHIVSHVEGELAPGRDALDALMAGFPAGTLSGAPKVRAMEIINEVETHKRGLYAGGVGYFAADGSMDTCIVLRTAIVKDGTMYVQAGGGVVADSDPASEYQETVNKARALFRAAEEALRFAAGGRGGQ